MPYESILVKTVWTAQSPQPILPIFTDASPGFSTLLLESSFPAGSNTGSAQLQGSNDDINWVSIVAIRIGTSVFSGGIYGDLTVGAAGPGAYVYVANVSGFSSVRLFPTTAITGTLTITVTASTIPSPIVISDRISIVDNFSVSDPVSPAGAFTPFSNAAVFATAMFVENTTPGNNSFVGLRTPAVFKSVSIAATVTGNTAVWTPAAGKKFRLMRFQVTAQGLAATATAVVTVSLQDAATSINIGTYDIDIPAVAGLQTGILQVSGGWIDLGNGVLSSTINNALNFNISAAGAGTVGTYRVNACGTEE